MRVMASANGCMHEYEHGSGCDLCVIHEKVESKHGRKFVRIGDNGVCFLSPAQT